MFEEKQPQQWKTHWNYLSAGFRLEHKQKDACPKESNYDLHLLHLWHAHIARSKKPKGKSTTEPAKDVFWA